MQKIPSKSKLETDFDNGMASVTANLENLTDEQIENLRKSMDKLSEEPNITKVNDLIIRK